MFVILCVLLVLLEYPQGTSLAAVICTVSCCFTNFAFPSLTSPAYSSFGTFTFFIRLHLLILVSRCDSVRIAPVLPKCALPFPSAFGMCASQEQAFEISTPRYVYWSAICNSSSPHFHLKVIPGSRYLRYIQPKRNCCFSRSLCTLLIVLSLFSFFHRPSDNV